jgi:hypothetical protein
VNMHSIFNTECGYVCTLVLVVVQLYVLSSGRLDSWTVDGTWGTMVHCIFEY